jgi:hypothetical protein
MATWLLVTVGLAVALVVFFVLLTLLDPDAVRGRWRRPPDQPDAARTADSRR